MSSVFGMPMADEMAPDAPAFDAPDDDVAAMPAPPIMLHDVKLVRKVKTGCARVEAVPPEEFGITRNAKLGAMQKTNYCFHQTQKVAANLIEQGFDEDSIDALPAADFADNEEDLARDTVDDRSDGFGAANLNRATRLVDVTEHYIRMEYEQKGKSKLYRVTTGGESGTILYREGKPAIEEVEEIPFASMTPYIVTHRFFGKSAADMVLDIQRMKTFLIRALNDNIALANNQRMEIAEDFVTKHTIDDLLTNRPGGIVRTKRPGGLIPIPNSDIGNFAYPLMEYYDSQREWRTGVTRQGQGIGSDSLKNVGEEALLSMFNAAQGRMRLIARIFAETGIRDMFLLLHAITRRNASKPDTVRLRRKWVEIDPSNWRRRDDMTVTVGLGSGSKGQQMAFMMQLLGLQKEAIMAPELGLVKPANIYNTLKRVIEIGDLRSIDPYFTDPEEQDDQGPQEPPPDPKMAEVAGKLKLQEQESQVKAQDAQARLQMDQQAAAMKAQADREDAAAKLAMDRQRIEMEHQASLRKIESDAQLRREQIAAEVQLKREQMEVEARVKFGTAALDGAVKAETEISEVEMGGEVG